MFVTVRSTRRELLPYSGFVMDGGADRTRPGVDIASLEVGRRYRVDWKNEQLRRTFRSTGTLLSIEVTPATTPGEEPERWLTFEVKPRFGRATVQRVDVATLRSIEPR
ncbi:MAG: hypothetical protein ACXWEJ_03865 [Actinomycetota bacterium]